MAFLVATSASSLPPERLRPNDDRWNAARSCQELFGWGGWVGGWVANTYKIMPLRGSILQAETCTILSLTENPRWSRVWQHVKTSVHKCQRLDESENTRRTM